MMFLKDMNILEVLQFNNTYTYILIKCWNAFSFKSAKFQKM